MPKRFSGRPPVEAEADDNSEGTEEQERAQGAPALPSTAGVGVGGYPEIEDCQPASAEQVSLHGCLGSGRSGAETGNGGPNRQSQGKLFLQIHLSGQVSQGPYTT